MGTKLRSSATTVWQIARFHRLVFGINRLGSAQNPSFGGKTPLFGRSCAILRDSWNLMIVELIMRHNLPGPAGFKALSSPSAVQNREK